MTVTEQLNNEKESEGTEAFLSGKLAQVDIAKIEKELKILWQSASDSGESGGSVTRACAMNLILYSEDSEAETVAGDVLDDITTRHPCRAILAISRDGEKPALDAWVSARCHITDQKSRKQICCEQITVRSEGNGPNELTSVVLPLVIADLPVFLWWRASKVDFHKIKPFLSYVDELIVDSAKADGSENIFADVLHIISVYLEEKNGAHIVVSDLNWRRSLLWREALALSFEPARGHLSIDALKDISTVQISYAADKSAKNSSGSLNQSLLYIGWLANRLDWQFNSLKAKEDAFQIEYQTEEKKTVTIELSGVECDASNIGNICSVEVEFADASLPCVVLSHPAGAPGVQMAARSGKDKGSATGSHDVRFRVNQATEARLIDLELETTDRDVALECAFRMAAVLADQIVQKTK